MFSFPRTLFTFADVDIIEKIKKLPKECYYLEHGGRHYNDVSELSENKLIQLHFRMCGGKGGFGSLLRSFRIHKSTNQLMCRNLAGRRLADVKEEERLQKWIEKKEERQRLKQEKKNEKYERLKRGHPKHEFKDQNYLRARDTILDQTEDAIEAGMKALEERQAPETTDFDASERGLASSSSSSDDSDFDLYNAPQLVSSSKKCKLANNEKSLISKKLKVEYTSEVIFEYFIEKIIEEIAQFAILEESKRIQDRTKRKASDKENCKTDESAASKKSKLTIKSASSIDYLPIDLEQFETADDLVILGLDHLKHALESLGLKCGGSLGERAARLFSVKGLRVDEYPKNIKAKVRN